MTAPIETATLPQVLTGANPRGDARLIAAVNATPTECRRVSVLVANMAAAANADRVMEAVQP